MKSIIQKVLHQVRRRHARFVYHAHLDSRIWNSNCEIKPLVANALNIIAWSYIAYLQTSGLPISDMDIRDVFIHGSCSNYYYDDTSDIDICIVIDLSNMRAALPYCDIQTLTKAMLGSWLRNHSISICGRGVDISVVDVNNPKYGPGVYKVGGAYSLRFGKWIRRSEKLTPHQLRYVRNAAIREYRNLMRQYRKIMRDGMGDAFIETFLRELTTNRRLQYDEYFLQPVTPGTMAFRMLRQRGVLRKLKRRAAKIRSKNFNVTL